MGVISTLQHSAVSVLAGVVHASLSGMSPFCALQCAYVCFYGDDLLPSIVVFTAFTAAMVSLRREKSLLCSLSVCVRADIDAADNNYYHEFNHYYYYQALEIFGDSNTYTIYLARNTVIYVFIQAQMFYYDIVSPSESCLHQRYVVFCEYRLNSPIHCRSIHHHLLVLRPSFFRSPAVYCSNSGNYPPIIDIIILYIPFDSNTQGNPFPSSASPIPGNLMVMVMMMMMQTAIIYLPPHRPSSTS